MRNFKIQTFKKRNKQDCEELLTEYDLTKLQTNPGYSDQVNLLDSNIEYTFSLTEQKQPQD